VKQICNPAPDDPVWQQILNNEIEVKIRQLGLKLLVSRARARVSNTTDPRAISLPANELHRYFEKHERFLQYELGQITGVSPAEIHQVKG